MTMGLIALNRVLNKLVDDLYDYAKSTLKKQIDRESIKRKIPHLIENELNQIRYVKTLWQVDRAVNIDDFYCDSYLLAPSKKHDKERSRKVVRSVSDFDTERNIVIRGIAGQGKSIFLRYICTREFEAGERVPIFIELRRIIANESLLDHVFKSLEALNLPVDEELFKFMSDSGKLIFFLDAFDEISPDISQRVVNEIEHLVTISPNCRFLVTTRPNSTIEMSPLFDIWSLDNLRGNEFKDVIHKLSDSPENAEVLIKRVETSKISVKALLCTPLLITLLIMCYKALHKIPEQLSDFYDSIFYVLLQRHDGTKPGFTRYRRCSINDNEYLEIFAAFCYETKRIRQFHFDSQTMYKIISKSMSISNIKENPVNYLKDIINITCLILVDGEEHRFIHRSVQDYYASTFIKSRPDIIVARFYQACLDFDVWKIWKSELDFLSDIDKYRYSKYFVLPLCLKWIGVNSSEELLNGCPPMTVQRAKHIIGHIGIGWDGSTYLRYSAVGYLDQIIDDNSIVRELFKFDYAPFIKKVQKGEIIIDYDLVLPKRGKSFVDVKQMIFYSSIHQILDEGFLIDELQAFAQQILDRLYTLWKDAYQYTNKQESIDIVPDLLADQ